MIDLLDAEQVEVTVDEMNKVWVNIDGRCVCSCWVRGGRVL